MAVTSSFAAIDAMSGSTDWISASSGLIAVIIALLTLFTVYVAALQVLSQRRIHEHGLSQSAIGPWRPKLVSSSLLGLRSKLYAPNISLSRLIEKDWKPEFAFPMGVDGKTNAPTFDLEMEARPFVLARTSWVNFMQALSIDPEDESLFDLQFQSALLNGNVPMRWRGPDLVGMCSILGYQSHEQKPEFHKPMELPMQWNGPLGYLQFREGFEGCVVEFRRRAVSVNYLPASVYDYYKDREETLPSTFVSRLCYSMGGFSVERNGKRQLFFIGSCDFERTLELLLAGIEKKRDKDKGEGEDGKKTDQERKDKGTPERQDSMESMNDIFQELETKSLDDDEILEKVWGVPIEETRKKRGLGPRKSEIRSELVKNAAEENRKKARKERGVVDVIKSSPGVLSITIQAEMACSRGLDLSNCVEYDRAFVSEEMVDETTHPYKLGNMAMDIEALRLFKDAMLVLKPDGFYFSPAGTLSADINDVYRHVKKGLAMPTRITPELSEADWSGFEDLYWASEMCNIIQTAPFKMQVSSALSVFDMRLMSKACACLQNLIEPTGQDLVWAMLVSPKLFSNVARRIRRISSLSVKTTLDIVVKIANEKLDYTVLMESDAAEPEKGATEAAVAVNERDDDGSEDLSDDEDEDSHICSVPLCADGEFSCAQLVAAFLEVCLTFYWLERKWITDVSMYSAAIPPTVMMF